MKSTTKYAVGDRVTVRKDLVPGKRYFMEDKCTGDCVVDAMMPLAGKDVTIVSTFGGKYRIRESVFCWTDEMFEDLKQTIVIYRNGSRVIAYDKKTKKRAEARCNPDDTFDFNTGAKLALDRLLGKTPSESFKPGDIVIGLSSADKRYCITRAGFLGVVSAVETNYPGGRTEIRVNALDKALGSYIVDPKYFRLATDADITLAALKKALEKPCEL